MQQHQDYVPSCNLAFFLPRLLPTITVRCYYSGVYSIVVFVCEVSCIAQKCAQGAMKEVIDPFYGFLDSYCLSNGPIYYFSWPYRLSQLTDGNDYRMRTDRDCITFIVYSVWHYNGQSFRRQRNVQPNCIRLDQSSYSTRSQALRGYLGSIIGYVI